MRSLPRHGVRTLCNIRLSVRCGANKATFITRATQLKSGSGININRSTIARKIKRVGTPINTRPLTSSGWRKAYSVETAPPKEWAIR